jgi:hypothetical protein
MGIVLVVAADMKRPFRIIFEISRMHFGVRAAALSARRRGGTFHRIALALLTPVVFAPSRSSWPQ